MFCSLSISAAHPWLWSFFMFKWGKILALEECLRPFYEWEKLLYTYKPAFTVFGVGGGGGRHHEWCDFAWFGARAMSVLLYQVKHPSSSCPPLELPWDFTWLEINLFSPFITCICHPLSLSLHVSSSCEIFEELALTGRMPTCENFRLAQCNDLIYWNDYFTQLWT